jgi:hypothetical protein
MRIELTRTPQQCPANGFEDRGASVHDCTSASTGVRSGVRTFHDRAQSSEDVQHVGCDLWLSTDPDRSAAACATAHVAHAPDLVRVQGTKIRETLDSVTTSNSFESMQRWKSTESNANRC